MFVEKESDDLNKTAECDAEQTVKVYFVSNSHHSLNNNNNADSAFSLYFSVNLNKQLQHS